MCFTKGQDQWRIAHCSLILSTTEVVPNIKAEQRRSVAEHKQPHVIVNILQADKPLEFTEDPTPTPSAQCTGSRGCCQGQPRMHKGAREI